MGGIFGLFAGVTTPLLDMKLFPVRREIVSGKYAVYCAVISKTLFSNLKNSYIVTATMK